MADSDPTLPTVRRRRDVTAPIRRREKRRLPDATLSQPVGNFDHGTSDFLPPALQVVQTPPSSSRRIFAYVICGLIVGGLAWSIFGHLRLFAIAPGQIQARGGSQVLQFLEVGQVKVIRVKNGDHVNRRDPLVELDPTAALASRAIIQANLGDARAEITRRHVAIKAASNATIEKDIAVDWPADIPEDVRTREESALHADLAQLAAVLSDLNAELKAKEAARDKFIENISAQKALIASRTERTGMHQKLADMGWDSQARVLESLEPLRQEQVSLATFEGSLGEANAAIPVVKSEIAKARDTFVMENTDKLSIAERQIEDLVQQLAQANQTLANLTLRAPISGIVQALAVTNTGQTVEIGKQILQIVPDGTPLEIQAYVLNTDIGFVKEGQPAVIKIDTFPYTRYGTIEGRVTHVGADAITGLSALQNQKNGASTPSTGPLSVSNAAEPTSDLVFPVTIVPSKSSIEVDGRDVALSSGMSVVVEIETERQRAIEYVLYPITRVWRSRPASQP